MAEERLDLVLFQRLQQLALCAHYESIARTGKKHPKEQVTYCDGLKVGLRVAAEVLREMFDLETDHTPECNHVTAGAYAMLLRKERETPHAVQGQ